MQYVINGMVTFNTDYHTLLSRDSTVDMITLNRISSELLHLFIRNNGVPIKRETFLSELWEKRGLNASSNNLNNYVSMLRKALTHCGCENVITTIPKHGFIFNADVVLQPIAEEEPASVELLPAVIPAVPAVIKYPRRTSTRSLSKWLPFLSVIIVLLVIAFSYRVYDHYRLASLRTGVFLSGQCRFWLIDDITRRMDADWVISRMKNIMKDEKINCDMQANVYFSADRVLDSRGKTVLNEMFSYCPFNSKAPCENYIYARYEGHND